MYTAEDLLGLDCDTCWIGLIFAWKGGILGNRDFRLLPRMCLEQNDCEQVPSYSPPCLFYSLTLKYQQLVTENVDLSPILHQQQDREHDSCLAFFRSRLTWCGNRTVSWLPRNSLAISYYLFNIHQCRDHVRRRSHISPKTSFRLRGLLIQLIVN